MREIGSESEHSWISSQGRSLKGGLTNHRISIWHPDDPYPRGMTQGWRRIAQIHPLGGALPLRWGRAPPKGEGRHPIILHVKWKDPHCYSGLRVTPGIHPYHIGNPVQWVDHVVTPTTLFIGSPAYSPMEQQTPLEVYRVW